WNLEFETGNLNRDHRSIVRERMRQVRQHLRRHATDLAEVFPVAARQVNEHDAADSTAAQIEEHFLRRKMREFADEQVKRLVEQRIEIIRLPEIGAVPDAQASPFEKKTVRAEIGPIFLLKTRTQSIEVRCGKRGRLNVADRNGLARLERE